MFAPISCARRIAWTWPTPPTIEGKLFDAPLWRNRATHDPRRFLFATADPMTLREITARLPPRLVILAEALVYICAITLCRARGCSFAGSGMPIAMRTAADLGYLMRIEDSRDPAKLSRARNRETLRDSLLSPSPTTRARSKEIRGVVRMRGTLDQLMNLTGSALAAVKIEPGRPVTLCCDPRVSGAFRVESPRNCQVYRKLRSAGLLEGRRHFQWQFQVSDSDEEPEAHRKARSELFEIKSPAALKSAAKDVILSPDIDLCGSEIHEMNRCGT